MAGHHLTPAAAPPGAAAVVDSYVAELAGLLSGPRRFRQRVADEIRDGLWEAAIAHAGAGAPTVDAARLAVADFGDPGHVAAGFAAEAAAAQARLTALAFTVTGPLVGVWWLLVLHPPGAWPWHLSPAALIQAIPALPLVAIACLAAVAALVTTGRPARLLPFTPRHALTAATVTALTCMAGDLVVLAVLAERTIAAPGTAPWLLATIATTCSLARLAFARHALATCSRTRRTLAPGDAL